MAEKLIHAKDSVYALNHYLAINGLQRFSYTYTGRETDIEEIGNIARVTTYTEPETSGSFEVTDTGALAALLARMRFDNATQQYAAGAESELPGSAFTITENDLQYMTFDLIEQKRPGGTFSEAKLIPNCFLSRFGVRLTADGVGSVSVDWTGNLLIPVYKPYHQVQSYAAVRLSDTQVELPSEYGIDTSTYGILGGMVNNIQLAPADLNVVAGGGNERKIDLTASGQQKIGSPLAADDRIMVWMYKLTPTDLVDIDYVNSVPFVKADRIDIWLLPAGTTVEDENRMLRVQSFDLSVDLQRDELKEIKRNETNSSTFFRLVRFPLNITGSINVLEETLHTWALLQGKTLNEAAASSPVDTDNVLDIASWEDAMIVARWYRYGSEEPIQDLTLAKVVITGYDGTQTVGGRKEAVWNWKSDGDMSITTMEES